MLDFSFEKLKALAQMRMDDALLLLTQERFSSAYYLAGYAVEIGLKACIALQFRAEHLPDRRFVNMVYTHQLEDLVSHAGLDDILAEKMDDDPEFSENWSVACQWTPESRYLTVDDPTATRMVRAVSDPEKGILTWIREYW